MNFGNSEVMIMELALLGVLEILCEIWNCEESFDATFKKHV